MNPPVNGSVFDLAIDYAKKIDSHQDYLAVAKNVVGLVSSEMHPSSKDDEVEADATRRKLKYFMHSGALEILGDALGAKAFHRKDLADSEVKEATIAKLEKLRSLCTDYWYPTYDNTLKKYFDTFSEQTSVARAIGIIMKAHRGTECMTSNMSSHADGAIVINLDRENKPQNIAPYPTIIAMEVKKNAGAEPERGSRWG